MSEKFLRMRFPRYGANKDKVRKTPTVAAKSVPKPTTVTTSPTVIPNPESSSGSKNNMKQYQVSRNQWYKLHVCIASTKMTYKKGLLKIFGDSERTQVFPSVKLPNILFTNVDTVKSIFDLDNLTEFNIYFKTTNQVVIQLNTLNLIVRYFKLEKVDLGEVKENVNIWKLRRFYDLEFLDYYLKNLYTDFNNQYFLDRFNGEYQLYKNNQYLDKFMAGIKIPLDKKPHQGTNVLLLTHSSILYEETDDTIRTQLCAEQAANKDINICVATRLGFPDDREPEIAKKAVRGREYNGITYYTLHGFPESKCKDIVEYLQNYIVETIKIAKQLNIDVIHATSNYCNGIAAIYAAKYLNISSVYEIRCFWEDSIIDSKPELFNSDLLNMRVDMETLVMQNADTIICTSDATREEVLDRSIAENKVVVIEDSDIQTDKLTEVYGSLINTFESLPETYNP